VRPSTSPELARGRGEQNTFTEIQEEPPTYALPARTCRTPWCIPAPISLDPYALPEFPWWRRREAKKKNKKKKKNKNKKKKKKKKKKKLSSRAQRLAAPRGRQTTKAGNEHRERMTGIEPALSAWEAEVLPLNYIRAYVHRDLRGIRNGVILSTTRR
jgi:hypothetical protein